MSESLETASELLTKVAEKYAACTTYSDTGIASCGSRSIEFKTYFLRPAKIYVEWKVPGAEELMLAVRANADRVFLYYQGKWIEQKSLDWALKVSAGASLGTSYFIPSFLAPEIVTSGPTMFDLAPFHFVPADTEFGDSQNYVAISSDEARDVIQKIEIDVESLSIRQRTSSMMRSFAANLQKAGLELERLRDFSEDLPEKLSAQTSNIVTVTQYRMPVFDRLSNSQAAQLEMT